MEYSTGSKKHSEQKIKLFSGPGTRRWPRFDISEMPSITGVRSKSGARIRIVNISRGGALLQTNERTALRKMIQLKLDAAEGTMQLSGFVLRSSVSFLKGMPHYQAAIVFDRPLQIFEDLHRSPAGTSKTRAIEHPQSGTLFHDSHDLQCKPRPDDDSAIISAFLALSLRNALDPEMDKMYELNDW
jgi:hypothetical protein